MRRFRLLSEVFANYAGGGEFELEDYSGYSGIVYSLGYDQKVFDVKNKTLLNTGWKH